MTDLELAEKMTDLGITLQGLREEVEGWRTHVDSASEFVLIEIDRLIGILNDMKKRFP